MMNKNNKDGAERNEEKKTFVRKETWQWTSGDMFKTALGGPYPGSRPDPIKEKLSWRSFFKGIGNWLEAWSEANKKREYPFMGSYLSRDSDADLTVHVDAKRLEKNEKSIDEFKKSQHDKNKDKPE